MAEDVRFKELENYLRCLTDKQSRRLIGLYVLKLSSDDLARFENISRQAFFLSIQQAKDHIKDFQTFDDLAAVLTEIIRKPLP